jgi:2-aminoadipate transaminase
MTHEWTMATRTAGMGANAIREILKVTGQPGMRSLAGGIPAPEAFPMEILRSLTQEAIDRFGSTAFQYGLTEGFGPLREQLVPFLAGKGVVAAPEQVLITTGSQGALSTIAQIMVSPGDVIAVEAPTYLGAISAFNPYEPRYVTIATDDAGVIPESLEEVVRDNPVRFVYLTPTFQNPTGRTLSGARRAAIADILVRYGVLCVEDDPYNDLRYRGEAVPALHALAPDHVVYLGTVSKVFAPGLRVGFAVAPPAIARWMVTAKQGIDLHTSSFNQALTALYLESGALARHLPTIISLYKPRQEAMLAALERHFPPEMRWTRPEGGMFVWAEGPAGLDTVAMYERAVARQVAYVPGGFFYAGVSARDAAAAATMRLNFTMVDEATIEAAIADLGAVVAAALEG